MEFGIILKAFAALMLAFIWAVYLRKVNVFTKISWLQILFPLIIGALSTIFVFELDLPDITKNIDPKNDVLLRFIRFTYFIALMEEFCKFAAFLLVAITVLALSGVLKRRSLIEEPNIIIYASLVALGFATVENYVYLEKSGISVVYWRGIMSTVSHIVATTIVAGFLIVGYRHSIFRAILYSFIGLVIATLVHGLYDFFLSFGLSFFFIVTLIIFSVQIEVWARILNNFLNFSTRIYLNKCLDRNTLQKFLLIAFLAAGMVQLIGLIYEEGLRKGILTHLNLLSQELIITIVLIVRITRFTVIPRYWQRILPVLPISIRRGNFQRSIIPTSPRFFLKIKGDEFNEYPFTSRIDQEVKLRALPKKEMDFDIEVNVKMITKKFIGPKKELYYLCEILDFHTIHPQFNSRYVLIRPKNYGSKTYRGTPIVGLIAMKGFVNLEEIHPKDCKFISWVIMKKEGEKTPSQRMLEMLK
jgi:RsiW-degrading membrane proteinase PrsW (M82 family)